MADLIVTAAHDAIHLVGTPDIPVRHINGVRYDGAPSVSVCGQRAIVGVNRLAADQLYPTLGDCPACQA